MKDIAILGIWVVVIGVIFAIMWRKGFLMKISNYVLETKEELRKCTWPTWDEIKGSSVVVIAAIALLGVFTVGIDFVISMLMRLII